MSATDAQDEGPRTGLEAPRPRVWTLKERLLLRPQLRVVRDVLRYAVRRHAASWYALRRSDAIDLAGREAALSEAIVGVVTWKRLDLLEWQVPLVREHLAEHESFVVFDNSPRGPERDAIRAYCRREGVPYVGLPDNPYNGSLKTASQSHGCALVWATRNVVARFRPKYFGFIDHDIFPLAPYRIADRLADQPVYGVRCPSSRLPNGWMLWGGFCFYRTADVPVRRMSFVPTYRYGMDTGGENWGVIYRDLDEAKLAFADLRFGRIGAGYDLHSDYVQWVDGWLHVMNASAWRQVDGDRGPVVLGLLRAATRNPPVGATLEKL
ncbi:hypothetical protein CCR97_24725 [Rhodoplanes elegans]|uniref:Uncharacterized protein n=1 Tax=Rhodoplanes elegans TaxID=29408 RepID=A0A327JXQ6_9BRAD|nr:hypothetical protein [Rhodoplanes elegans]MBK5961385.1 hypothetical protein [Rhodoplanes elegans]RAI31310.1 hypothetical protein CH338_26045 [Rhodoplanes elegans]